MRQKIDGRKVEIGQTETAFFAELTLPSGSVLRHKHEFRRDRELAYLNVLKFVMSVRVECSIDPEHWIEVSPAKRPRGGIPLGANYER